MKTLNEINEIIEAIRIASLSIEPEDIGYVSEMIRTAAKFDKTYATAYEKMHNIFMYATPGTTVEPRPTESETKDDEALNKIDKMTEEARTKIDKMGEEAKKSIHQELEDFRETLLNDSVEEIDEAAETLINHAVEERLIENDKLLKQQAETEPPIIFQHPDYPTIGAGSDGQVYGFKDGKWKKADARAVYFPKKKDGTWGRVEREEILDLLNNYNTSAWDEPQPETTSSADEYETLPEGFFIHPTISVLAANEDGRILKFNTTSKKWAPAETNEDGRGCRKVKGEKIGTGKCVYECINRRTVSSHVRHLNGDSWDDSFSNLTVYGDKNYHKFQQRTYGESDIHEICEYICKHNGDVSNISHDSTGKYSIYYARKILTKTIHDNISDKYFGYTAGGSLRIYKEGEVK